MYKTIVILFLATINTAAMAEWVEVTGDENATGYADSATSNQLMNIVRMWELVDYKTPKAFTATIKPVTYSSTVSQVEYNCGRNELRRLGLTLYSEHMGKGEPVYSNPTTGEWVVIKPNSNGEAMFKKACDKK